MNTWYVFPYFQAVGLFLVAAGVMATITGSNYGAQNAAPNEFVGLVFCLVWPVTCFGCYRSCLASLISLYSEIV